MPLARLDAQFLKAKQQPVDELPPGLKLTYAPHLVHRAWRKWVHTGRRVVPDIRAVAIEDEDSENDVWTWELVVRYLSGLDGDNSNGSDMNMGEEGLDDGR